MSLRSGRSDEEFEDSVLGFTASQPVDNLEQLQNSRYGAKKRKKGDFLLYGALATALLAIGAAFFFNGNLTSSKTSVSVRDVKHKIVSAAEAELTFEVTAPSDMTVACAIEALSPSNAPVGYYVTVLQPSGTPARVVTQRIRTNAEATTITARLCWEQQDVS